MANFKVTGLPNKRTSPSNICLKNKNGLLLDSLSIAETFKKHSSLVKNLVLKLSKPPDIFGIQSMNNYYKKCNLKKNLLFSKTESDKVFKILKNLHKSKAACIDDLSGIFLKDGVSLLAKLITQLCNLSISSSRFPDT